LITGMLWREAQVTGTVGLRGFYGARARRLLPASAFVGVVILFVSAAMLPRLQARSAIWDGITSALYVSNYRFILQDVDYMHASAMPSPFQHYWSLGVEEQFYLVWPALIMGTAWFVRRFRRRTRTEATASLRPFLVVLASVAIVSFALSLVLTYWMAPVAFFSLPTRAWQLAVGGLIALTATRWHRLSARAAALIGWIGLAVVMATCTLFGEATPYPGAAALAPTLGTAMVIAAGCAAPPQGVGRLLGVSPLRYIGRISYSWYLWHWPVLLMIFWSYVPALGHPVEFGLAGVLISAGLAMVTLRFVE
ncbi:acyltransferase, partial [Mycobacterium sp. ITM-2017-0098]